MKIWFLEHEVEAFRPLRLYLPRSIFEKINISENLINKGYSRIKILNEIYRGYINPDYTNYIFVLDNAYLIKDYTIEEVDTLRNVMRNKTPLVFSKIPFLKFSKHKAISISFNLNLNFIKKDKNFINQDLIRTATYIGHNSDFVVYETKYFVYKINHSLEVIDFYYKYNNTYIKNITWFENGFNITFIDDLEVLIQDEYIESINTYLMKKNYHWYLEYNEKQRISNIVESINNQWIVNPKIWDSIEIEDIEEKQILMDVWFNDLKYNAFIKSNNCNSCLVSGWKFNYVWEGLILKEILTPDNKEIFNVIIENENIKINNELTFKIQSHKPETITDLVVGNKLKLLPKSKIFSMEILDHAINRYTQRIDDSAYLCELISDIYVDLYENGNVIDGAHLKDRRKISTKKCGYVLNDKNIISLWNNDKTVERKLKHKKNTIKVSSKIRHLERMVKIMDSLKYYND